ncbi:MAG: phenylalanine--tRNA ligase subunit beta, partial [Thermodesulfobacteriota bacterium]|nr:phenylalanine--tRNA ligase subunit beta [Thermodesulfobacteriota bacterium]
MIVSLSWLKDYIPIKMDAEDLAEALTMAGLEVEAASDRYNYLNTVVVGRIVEVNPHPNADKLKLCSVDTGDRIIPVVCGAPNTKKNMLAPCALPGTCFPNGIILEKNVIRGEVSQGMLCSPVELGLGISGDGIMELDQNLVVGDKLNHALGLSDTVFEIDLTPNRPDCLSIIGTAREIAAFQKTKVSYPEINLFEPLAEPPAESPDTAKDISHFSSVTIMDPDLCPRYSARLVFDIKIEPSPFWLQGHLVSVGLKPINNIV